MDSPFGFFFSFMESTGSSVIFQEIPKQPLLSTWDFARFAVTSLEAAVTNGNIPSAKTELLPSGLFLVLLRFFLFFIFLFKL